MCWRPPLTARHGPRLVVHSSPVRRRLRRNRIWRVTSKRRRFHLMNHGRPERPSPATPGRLDPNCLDSNCGSTGFASPALLLIGVQEWHVQDTTRYLTAPQDMRSSVTRWRRGSAAPSPWVGPSGGSGHSRRTSAGRRRERLASRWRLRSAGLRGRCDPSRS